MKNKINFEIKKVNYDNRCGNLKVKASSVVKSNKFFPTYIIDNKSYIFKPLSKTKPLTTTLFSYAEVVWSYIFDTYFCKAPLYQLSICDGYERNEGKYYDNGCLVENILKSNEHLVNLYEYFRDNKDEKVDINDYVNYCMMFYDYTNILETKIFKERKDLAHQLVMQILLSILSINQNFHYENIAFICNENNEIIELAPPIDHEFSSYFLFPDDINKHKKYFDNFIEELNNKESVTRKNIEYIKENYSNIVIEFLEKLTNLKNEILTNSNLFLFEDYGFVQEGNSFSYMIGKSRYKENDEKNAKIYELIFKPIKIDLQNMNKLFLEEIVIIIDLLFVYLSLNL